MIEHVFARADQFDIIHFHTDYLQFPLARRHGVRSVTTLHGRLDLPCLPHLYREFRDMPLVSISDAQRKPLPWANWRATVHHGLPADLLKLGDGSGGYLVFAGRIAPDKRPDLAIEIARRAGIRLVMAAKVSELDRAYFEQVIAPMLKGSGVEFIGEVGEQEKPKLFGDALAMLFPIDWPEPFGLVMIESMACGTPVIAMRRGSVPEVIDEGESGFIVDTVDEAVTAVERAGSLQRSTCRACFEHRFTAARMARDYLRVYQERKRGAGAERTKGALGAVHG
jgi:glycosyltransferase involved in cell wall biosynthesis